MLFKDLLKVLGWDMKLYILPLMDNDFEPVRSVEVIDIKNKDEFRHLDNLKVTSVTIAAIDEYTIFL